MVFRQNPDLLADRRVGGAGRRRGATLYAVTVLLLCVTDTHALQYCCSVLFLGASVVVMLPCSQTGGDTAHMLQCVWHRPCCGGSVCACVCVCVGVAKPVCAKHCVLNLQFYHSISMQDYFIYFLNSGLFLCAQAAQLSGSSEMRRSCRAALHHHHHHHRRRWEESGRQHESLPVTVQDFLPRTHSHKSTAAAVGL